VTAARAAEQRLVAAEATLEQARNAILYADLVAPATGVILDVEGQVGQVVSPSQAVARLAEDGPREIEVQVPESRRVGLPTEATARLATGAGPAKGPTGGSASARVTCARSPAARIRSAGPGARAIVCPSCRASPGSARP
jgi:multidrug efflux pump subunit AcrA (membrane-fusion protein)